MAGTALRRARRRRRRHCRRRSGAAWFTLLESGVETAWFQLLQLLKVQCDRLLSTFAFNLRLRRYAEVGLPIDPDAALFGYIGVVTLLHPTSTRVRNALGSST